MIARSAIIPLTKSSVLHDLAWASGSVKYLSVKYQGKFARGILQGDQWQLERESRQKEYK
jgi:hypothetical protein